MEGINWLAQTLNLLINWWKYFDSVDWICADWLAKSLELPIDCPNIWIWSTESKWQKVLIDWPKAWNCQLTGPKLGIADWQAKYLDLIDWIHVTKGTDWLVQSLLSRISWCNIWIWLTQFKWYKMRLTDPMLEFADWLPEYLDSTDWFWVTEGPNWLVQTLILQIGYIWIQLKKFKWQKVRLIGTMLEFPVD